jgi:hypothetical protein
MATSSYFIAPHNVVTMGHFVSQKKPLNWLQEPFYCGKIFMFRQNKIHWWHVYIATNLFSVIQGWYWCWVLY